jgi:hypothetical protein
MVAATMAVTGVASTVAMGMAMVATGGGYQVVATVIVVINGQALASAFLVSGYSWPAKHT